MRQNQAEALGDGWSHAVHPDDKLAVFAHWQHSAELKQEFDMEFRVRRRDGTVRHVRSVARALLDGDEGVTGYVGSVEDTTEGSVALAIFHRSRIPHVGLIRDLNTTHGGQKFTFFANATEPRRLTVE